MENPWQTRCGSFWHSPSHDSHTQDSMLLTNGIIQDPMLSNEHGLDNLAHANFGASFLSLVSGTTSHVACDVQYLLDPKPVSAANLASSNRRTANAFDGGTRVSILPSALWPSNWNCLNLTSGDSFSSFTSSHTNVNCSYSSAHLNFQKSRDVVCHNNHEINKANLVSSLIGNNNASPLSTDSWKLPKSAHTSFLQEIPIESNVSSYHHGCNSSGSSLRVFCLGMSGNLLLSDTGLLGVVCACHGLYMSISKFSEHSGSCDVNPGDAVRMENGESLAHWLKTFSRTGIRVLEGQRGWDWPDGISVAAGFANHHTASMLSLQQQNYSETCSTQLVNICTEYRSQIIYIQKKLLCPLQANLIPPLKEQFLCLLPLIFKRSQSKVGAWRPNYNIPLGLF